MLSDRKRVRKVLIGCVVKAEGFHGMLLRNKCASKTSRTLGSYINRLDGNSLTDIACLVGKVSGLCRRQVDFEIKCCRRKTPWKSARPQKIKNLAPAQVKPRYSASKAASETRKVAGWAEPSIAVPPEHLPCRLIVVRTAWFWLQPRTCEHFSGYCTTTVANEIEPMVEDDIKVFEALCSAASCST